MQIVKDINDIKSIKNNKIIGLTNLVNSSIEFTGENNILYCGDRVNLINCKIRFTASNSIIYIDDNEIPINISARVGNDSVIYVGKNTYINKMIFVYATERKNIIIGNDCLISHDVYFRTSDPHQIYDIATKKRINDSKSIFVGDHVWIGQKCLILKNSRLHSGSVIGGQSFVSGKVVQSNTLYAGSPIRKIKENIFFTPGSTHNFTSDDILKYSEFNNDKYVYNNDKLNYLSFDKIDKDLNSILDVNYKIDYIKMNLSNNTNKNRFAYKDENV